MSQKTKINPTFSPRKNHSRSQTSVKKHSRRNSKSRLSPGETTSTVKKNQHPKKKSATNSSRKSHSRLAQVRKQRQRTITVPPPLALLFRITILTVGIGTILGSIISVANSLNSNPAINNTAPSSTNQTIQDPKSSSLENLFSLVAVGQEIIPLRKQLQTITQKYSQLEAGILIADIENKSYVNIAGTNTFSAASTIKLPILVAFFQDVDAGKIDLNESLTVTKKNLAQGSGYMRYQPLGSKFSALKTATSMITVSDNTATNMLIEHLGGTEALNQRFADWGLTATKVRNPLPDLTGTNTTSPEDLSNLLLKIDRGELVTRNSQERILKIMKQTEINNLLPQGLGKGATIAHKTGNINSILGDTGIVDMPNGKRYIVSVLVKRPKEDSQAQSLIQEVSRTTYQYFQHQPSKSTARQKKSQSPEKQRSFLAE